MAVFVQLGIPLLAHVSMKSMTSLEVESWFAIIRSKWPVPSSLQYSIMRGQEIVERAKQTRRVGTGFSYHLGLSHRGSASKQYGETGAVSVPAVTIRKPDPRTKQYDTPPEVRQRGLELQRRAAAIVGGATTLRPTDNAKEKGGSAPFLFNMQAAASADQ